jgi:hypothetical protein
MVAESGIRPSLLEIMLTRGVEFRPRPDYIEADFRPSQPTTLIGPNGQAVIAQGAQTFAPAASGASLGSGVGGQSVVGDTLGFNRAPSMNAPDSARPVEMTGSAGAEVREQATPLAQNGSPSELPVSGREDASRTAIGDATADRMVAGPFADGRPTGVFADREQAVPLGRNGITQSGDPQLISGADRFAPGNSPIAGGSASDRALAPPAQSAGSEKVFADREQAVPLPPNGATQNGAAGSTSQADQSTDSSPEDYQDATYRPVQPTTVLSSNGQPMGVQLGSSGDGSRLDGLRPGDLSQMSRKDIDDALPSTDLSKVSEESKRWLIENNFANDALKEFSDKGNSDSVQAELAEGYALSGLSQAVIRDVGPPTAVQVRISAPDKL